MRGRRHGSKIPIVVWARYETQKRDSPQFDALAPLIIYANNHVAWLYLLITAALQGSHFAARVYVRHKLQLRTSAHVLLTARWRSDIQREQWQDQRVSLSLSLPLSLSLSLSLSFTPFFSSSLFLPLTRFNLRWRSTRNCTDVCTYERAQG